MMMFSLRVVGLSAATALLAGAVSAQDMPGGASTKLRRCGDQTCLRISGRRTDPAAPVFVEQHAISVVGGRRWHVSLPLQTVRSWSGPFARSILVAVAGQDGHTKRVALPIGVFGNTTELAFLDISAHR